MILTIDDDDEVNYIHSRMSESIGIDCIDARSYKYALEILNESKTIKLILCDMYFKGDSRGGLDFINRSKEMGITVPIVIVSGSIEPLLPEICLKAGAWRFVKKPLTKEKLRVLYRSADTWQADNIKLMNDSPLIINK